MVRTKIEHLPKGTQNIINRGQHEPMISDISPMERIIMTNDMRFWPNDDLFST